MSAIGVKAEHPTCAWYGGRGSSTLHVPRRGVKLITLPAPAAREASGWAAGSPDASAGWPWDTAHTWPWGCPLHLLGNGLVTDHTQAFLQTQLGLVRCQHPWQQPWQHPWQQPWQQHHWGDLHTVQFMGNKRLLLAYAVSIKASH